MCELSVIVPTYNGARRLGRCLESLRGQTLPPDRFEVVVVLDGSTDETARMLAASDTPFRLLVIEQRNQGAAAARNAGVQAAQGTYCVFVDDDVVASPPLLAEHLRVQREQGGVVGLGAIPTVVAANAGWLTRCVARDLDEHFARMARGVRAPSWRDCYGGNLSVPRTAFLAVGGFAADMRRGHDVELGYRLAESGLRLTYIPDAIGTQELGKGDRELYADLERYGANAVEIVRRHRRALAEAIPEFEASGGGPVWLRRLLLATRVPPRLVGAVGSLARAGRWSEACYRLVHRYCFWRGLRRDLANPEGWWQLTHGTPVLVYRQLGTAAQAVERHAVPLARFARQLAWLKLTGHQVLGMEQYRRVRREYRLPPKRSVVILLEDGSGETCALANPLLRRHGYPAASLLAGGYVSDSHAVPPTPGGSMLNTHRTPPEALQRTEVQGTDSLARFAWKVARASIGVPRLGGTRSMQHLARWRRFREAR